MKKSLGMALLALALSSTSNAQSIVGEAERLWGEGDTIDGNMITEISEGAVDGAGNVISRPGATLAMGGEGQIIVTTINGVPTVIAREGDAAPGGDIIEGFDNHVERLGDLVLYVASDLDDNPNNGDGDRALLLRDLNETDPVVIARTGVTAVPGRAVTFDQIRSGEGFGMGRGGRIAFAGRFEDGGSGSGVYLWDNGSLSKIVDTDESVRGTQFNGFDHAKVDENGSGVVFFARRDSGAIGSIFLFAGGDLIELISTTDDYPGSVSSIFDLGEPDIDGGKVSVLVEGSGGERGIFIFDGQGNTTLVADLNTPLPDSPQNTGPATGFADELGIGGDIVYFEATRPNGSNEIMVWRNGLIERLPSQGDVLDGRELEITASRLERHSMSRSAIVIVASFVDGTEALYRVPLSAAPSSTPATGIPIPWLGFPLGCLLLLIGALSLRRQRQV
ncbi:MAG: hypothetical protein AAGI88_02990 [Pseudomonadota bacterium]